MKKFKLCIGASELFFKELDKKFKRSTRISTEYVWVNLEDNTLSGFNNESDYIASGFPEVGLSQAIKLIQSHADNTDHHRVLSMLNRQHIAAMEYTSSTDFNKKIITSATLIVNSFKDGGKLLICGNGGSAADAQHFAAELTGRFKTNRDALPAIALTTDTSAITAIGNDFGFNCIFSRQVSALAKKDDVLFLISTSGNSENILTAVSEAKCTTISLLGGNGGKMKGKTHLELIAPADSSDIIQEMHIVIIHRICQLVESMMEENK